MHPRRDLRFSNENVQLVGGNFYGTIFTWRELSSRRECYQDYQDFASRQDSRRDPGEEFFLGGIPAGRDFSTGFLPRYAAGIFPGKDPAGKTGHLGRIPAGSRYLFYKGTPSGLFKGLSNTLIYTSDLIL